MTTNKHYMQIQYLEANMCNGNERTMYNHVNGHDVSEYYTSTICIYTHVHVHTYVRMYMYVNVIVCTCTCVYSETHEAFACVYIIYIYCT